MGTDLVQRIPTNGTIRGDLTGQLPYMGRNLETVFIKSVNREFHEGIGWFSIPEGTFPGLVRVCDKLHFGWQAIAGALPHALINLLMQTDLPSLKLLSTHTSAGMDPVGEHMHNLEEASYSIHPFSPERLNVDIVSAQINHLLLLPYLRKLQVHDQIPTVSIHGLRLELACYGLMYLDLGLITVSFSSTVGILQTLQKLQTLIFAISDLETVVNVGALGDEPLSKSLQTIGMYVIKNKSLIIDNCPSRVILSRLSNIYQVQVQSDSMAVAEYFRSLAQAKAFKWSQSVADQVSVVQTDLFGRAT
ncbi:hypothetical protein FBU59_004278 [Linderina macrospora]|uniref:Uncharacterized protein n=1 Tax=Linderina macrospora TaxID=4868 RepID=A0ACC1J5Y0_9FUNG|nr:hypothetical protein FBU59_004278 [Linderina macrospora]